MTCAAAAISATAEHLLLEITNLNFTVGRANQLYTIALLYELAKCRNSGGLADSIMLEVYAKAKRLRE